MEKIILASQSPRRKELLEQIGLNFEIEPSNYQEDMSLRMAPGKLAKYLSLGKAKDVAKRHKNSIIIAADTFCVLGKEVFGKPKTVERAKMILHKFSGRAHAVITGFTIIDTRTDKSFSEFVKTKVYFKKLSEEEINAYVATGEPLNFAGAYAIQHLGGLFVRKIVGDYSNIIGLPIPALAAELEKFGINILLKHNGR